MPSKVLLKGIMENSVDLDAAECHQGLHSTGHNELIETQVY